MSETTGLDCMDYSKSLDYISRIYADTPRPRHQEYIDRTLTDDFVPVIEDEVADFFRVVLHLVSAQHVLEIGMSIGFSTSSIANAIKPHGGHVTSLEIDSDIVEFARKNFERLGLEDSIEVRIGDASELITEFESETFDVVFQDADKTLYPLLLDECIRVLKPGGLFLADDAFIPLRQDRENWDARMESIHTFNKKVAHSRDLESTIIPIGDGITFAVKRTS
ncbi:MAG: O-methyltransferase [Candidatus Thorarchaeota archaeon]